MTIDIKQSSTQAPLSFLMIDSSDHITGKTGLTPTVTISKAGAAFASPAGSVTEISSGWYKIAGNATDTATLGPLLLHATGSGADPTDIHVANIVGFDPQSATDGGLSKLTSLTFTVSNQVDANTLSLSTTLRPGIRKNTALAAFEFLMVDTSGNPATGLTVTPTRSIDGAAFAAGTLSAVTEVSAGMYAVDFGAGDLNGTVITLKCTATGAKTTFVTIKTSP